MNSVAAEAGFFVCALGARIERVHFQLHTVQSKFLEAETEQRARRVGAVAFAPVVL